MLEITLLTFIWLFKKSLLKISGSTAYRKVRIFQLINFFLSTSLLAFFLLVAKTSKILSFVSFSAVIPLKIQPAASLGTILSYIYRISLFKFAETFLELGDFLPKQRWRLVALWRHECVYDRRGLVPKYLACFRSFVCLFIFLFLFVVVVSFFYHSLDSYLCDIFNWNERKMIRERS